MSCTCQYLITGESIEDGTNAAPSSIANVSVEESTGQSENSKTVSGNVSASEVSARKAEVWVLKKKLSASQISVENLELLVKSVVERQNQLVAEITGLKLQNTQLQEECRMQRDYQTMERNVMIREIYELKVALGDRTRLLKRTMDHNEELKQKLREANGKIYTLCSKFFQNNSNRIKIAASSSSLGTFGSLNSILENLSHHEGSGHSECSESSERSGSPGHFDGSAYQYR